MNEPASWKHATTLVPEWQLFDCFFFGGGVIMIPDYERTGEIALFYAILALILTISMILKNLIIDLPSFVRYRNYGYGPDNTAYLWAVASALGYHTTLPVSMLSF